LADPLSADSMLTAGAGAEISAPKGMQCLPNESHILMLLHNHMALQVLHISEGQHRFGERSQVPETAHKVGLHAWKTDSAFMPLQKVKLQPH
jgi:hypothetical protein